MLYHNGTLCAQERAERRLARTTVNTALHSFESKTARLVAAVISQLRPQTAAHCTIEQLLALISTHPLLTPETATLQRYCTTFPELAEVAARQRERTLTQARQQLADALWPYYQARRFAYTKGYRAA
jgi:hypothetical protein